MSRLGCQCQSSHVPREEILSKAWKGQKSLLLLSKVLDPALPEAYSEFAPDVCFERNRTDRYTYISYL